MVMHNPIVVHMCAMLDQLDEAPLRAAYMVVQQLYTLQNNHNTIRADSQGGSAWTEKK